MIVVFCLVFLVTEFDNDARSICLCFDFFTSFLLPESGFRNFTSGYQSPSVICKNCAYESLEHSPLGVNTNL